METYIISDLKLYDNEQRDRLGYSSFDEMNNAIIYSWNRVVKPRDIVIIMGDIGKGTLEEMTFVISHLNGKKISTSMNLNNNFSKAQWKQIGFSQFWHIDLFNKFPNKKKAVYAVNPIHSEADYIIYDLIVVDSNNSFPGRINKNMLSVEAAKWDYSPLNTKDLFTIYENMKTFEELDFNEESVTEIKEEWEK